MSFKYCQSQIEDRGKCDTQCDHCKAYYAPLENVELYCECCGTRFIGPEPQMCCSGYQCGCMGRPTEPILCSEECWIKMGYYKPTNT